jgi:GNAT superfamily N-acetyltransferase
MTAPSIELTPAAPADAEDPVALRIAAMRESLEQIGRFDPARARERFLSGYVPEHTRHVVVAGRRVGFVVVKPEVGGLLLDHLYIRPDHQNQGVGAAVLAVIFADADARAMPIRCGALKGSASNRFYARHGFAFAAEGEWDNYYVRTPAATQP